MLSRKHWIIKIVSIAGHFIFPQFSSGLPMLVAQNNQRKGQDYKEKNDDHFR